LPGAAASARAGLARGAALTTRLSCRTISPSGAAAVARAPRARAAPARCGQDGERDGDPGRSFRRGDGRRSHEGRFPGRVFRVNSL